MLFQPVESMDSLCRGRTKLRWIFSESLLRASNVGLMFLKEQGSN